MDKVCVVLAEIIPLAASIGAFVYGIMHFFKKGRPLYLQSITMAMGCHSLGSIYRICQTLTGDPIMEGFTAFYLGRIGFFLFFVAASYGQMDRIVDDGSDNFKKSRLIALVAPAVAAGMYVFVFNNAQCMLSTKITHLLVWIPAVFAVYFNLKHAVIPNLDFGFIEAIKPYNILAVCLEFTELICLSAWVYMNGVLMVISSSVFGILCMATMISARKGVEKWTI